MLLIVSAGLCVFFTILAGSWRMRCLTSRPQASSMLDVGLVGVWLKPLNPARLVWLYGSCFSNASLFHQVLCQQPAPC